MENMHTPWLRIGSTVYALEESGKWHKGQMLMQNRFTAQVQAGPNASPSEVQAVAQLMMAAPELLEALEGVLSAAEHAYHTAAFTDPDGGDWWERINRARAAIAKSTGADQ